MKFNNIQLFFFNVDHNLPIDELIDNKHITHVICSSEMHVDKLRKSLETSCQNEKLSYFPSNSLKKSIQILIDTKPQVLISFFNFGQMSDEDCEKMVESIPASVTTFWFAEVVVLEKKKNSHAAQSSNERL